MTYASDRSKIRDIRKIKCLRESSNPEYPGHKLDTFEEVLEDVGGGRVDTIAVAGYNLMPKIVYDDLSSAAAKMGKGSIVRGDELIMQLRMVKSPAEIACLKKAGEITVKGLENQLKYIKPGMTEQQIVGLAMEAIYANGGEMEAYPFWALAGHGSNQAISRPRGKVIERHDYVHLNVGARYEGYAASLARGVFFGEPDPWVLGAIEAGYKAAGVVAAELTMVITPVRAQKSISRVLPEPDMICAHSMAPAMLQVSWRVSRLG